MVEWEDFSEDKCPICGHPSDIDSVSQHMEAQHHVEYGLARVILKMIGRLRALEQELAKKKIRTIQEQHFLMFLLLVSIRAKI